MEQSPPQRLTLRFRVPLAGALALGVGLLGCGGGAKVLPGPPMASSGLRSSEAATAVPDPSSMNPTVSSPLGALRLVNSGSQLGAIASGSVIYAYGSGLAAVDHVYLTLYPPSGSGSTTYKAFVNQASDSQLLLTLPAIPVPADCWARVRAYSSDVNGHLTEQAEANTYLESVAPGLYSADSSGQGAPLGIMTYSNASGHQETHPLTDPLRADPGSSAVATFWLTGGIALPTCWDGTKSSATATLVTSLGAAQVPIGYLGTVPGAGYQQLNVDLTEWLRSPLAQDSAANFHISVQGCREQISGGAAFVSDSNDLTLALSNGPAPSPSPGDPWPSLSAQAPLISTTIGGEHLNSVLPYADTFDAWMNRVNSVRTGFLAGARLAPFPLRNPLNAIFSRARMRGGYTVENVAFESTPGFFVTGNLFKPLHRNGPLPAILLSHGHFGDFGGYARTLAENQILATRLAQMGAVVLTYDMVGWGDAQQLDHPDSYGVLGFGDQDHFKDGTSNNLVELQLWDSVRGIDLLQSLQDTRGQPLVDSNRIGVTGASGGATQSLYVATADPRISAAALVVMITAGFTGDDWCEDGMPVHTVPGQANTNNTELAALFAPKPLLIISDGADWTQWFPRDEYPYIKKIYGYYGAEDRGLNFHFPNEGHDYGYSKRNRAYDFFVAAYGMERLKDSNAATSSNPEGVPLEREPTLRVFSSAFPKPNEPMIHLLKK